MDAETLKELFDLVWFSISYLSFGIAVSIFVAMFRKGEDKYWWAIFSLFFPIFFLLFEGITGLINKAQKK